MPFGDNRFGDVGGDVRLGAAGDQELGHVCVHAVDRGARLEQRVDLRGVLDHPQSAQHAGGQHGNLTEHLGQWQQVQRGHRVGHRSGDPSAPQRVGDQPVRVVAIDPVPHCQAQFHHRGLLERRQLHARHHHGGLTGRGQYQCRQPLERLGP
jgi:hypothetical protein